MIKYMYHTKKEYNNMISLPNTINKIIGNEKYITDNIGMSGSNVLLFSDKVLKIQNTGDEAENEYIMMKWLIGKIPVPNVFAYENEYGKSYLLMSKSGGEMSCSDYYMNNPELLMELLSKAVHMLWNVNIADCPSKINLDKKLEMAEYAVANNLIDMDNVEPDTFGENGFKNPHELLDWLIRNRPDEDLVLSHGDFCLPNIFFSKDAVSGFIDLGKMCVADRYQDIAICYRSIKHNFNGKYGGKVYSGFNSDMFFEKLGIKPDWKKIKYYILLDELF